MDFRTEFFPLLNEALYKEENDIPKNIINNSDISLMNRYTSFYNPLLALLINKTINKLILSFTKDNSGEYLFEVLKSIVPKLNKTYISYISKNKSKLVSEAENFVKDYSERHNISEREVWNMIYQLDNLKN